MLKLKTTLRSLIGVWTTSTSATASEATAKLARLAGWRIYVYALLIAILAGWAGFTRLGEGMLCHDEAAFAYTTDSMLRTGDWVVLRVHEKFVHLNAAPLYNWLTCLTADLFPNGDVRYRVWSAVFGVACGLAVLVLGTLLFRPEVGFLASILLLTNFQFLFAHGYRNGVMEPGTAFFITCDVIAYVRTQSTIGRSYWAWWAASGVAFGLAALMKPPAFPGFFFAMLCGHHTVMRRDLPLRIRAAGPLVAGLFAVGVAATWYVPLYNRLGLPALKGLFVNNSVGRAWSSGGYSAEVPRTYYASIVNGSSLGFQLALPAVAVGLVAGLFLKHGRPWGLLALLSGAFLIAISVSATKHQHYVYHAYPFLALLAAALLLAGFGPPPVTSPRFRHVWRVVAIGGACVAIVLVSKDFRKARQFLKGQHWDYPPLVFEQGMATQIDNGRGRLILLNYPTGENALDTKWGFSYTEPYYDQFRMPHAEHALDTQALEAMLADGKPSVVFLAPMATYSQLIEDGLRTVPDRGILARSELCGYPVLLFNGAEAKLNIAAPIASVRHADIDLVFDPAKSQR